MKKMYGSLIVSMLGFNQTVKAVTAKSEVVTDDVTCDEEVREFVLTSDDPLFECLSNEELSSDQLLMCKKIVSCMTDEGVVVGKDTIVMFGKNNGGSTSTNDPKVKSK